MSKKRKPHLTTAQADAIQLYIWQIRDLLGLGQWDLFIAADPCEDDVLAHIQPTQGKREAAISVNRTWWTDRSPTGQRDDIVHECLHALHRDQTDTIRVALNSGIVPDKTRHMWWELFANATEIMVDHLARVIAPTLPLPDFERTEEDAIFDENLRVIKDEIYNQPPIRRTPREDA